MARADVHAFHHFQLGCLESCEQIGPRAQSQVFGDIGQDEPAFPTGFEMRAQAIQETSQHTAVWIINRMFYRCAGTSRNPWRIANDKCGFAFGE